MKRFSRLQFLIAIFVSVTCAAANADDALLVLPPCAVRSESIRCAGALSSRDRFRSVRVAPGGPANLTDSFLEQLKKAGYNTVFLSDVAGHDATKWTRVPAETIKQWLMLARKHDVSVIAFSAFVEPLLDETPAATMRVRYLTAGEVRTNLLPWQKFNQGEVIALAPLGDDPFYLGIPAEKQMEWSRLARAAAPSIPMLGVIGEFALSMTIEEARRYWAPSAYSYVALVMYPYNLGQLWGHPLNHDTSADPDGDLTRYVHDYVRAQYTRFLIDLDQSQTVLPVIQTFTYQGEDAGIVPRAKDITLQARLIHDEMQVTLGQTDNYAIGYFYLGADPATPTILKGIGDIPGWPDVVAHENALMEQQFRSSIPAVPPHHGSER